MSVYGINKFFRTCLHDKAFRELAKSDPEAAMERMPLTSDEKDMLRRGDVAALYEHGAHAFLLTFYTRWDLFGVTVAEYTERIHQAKDWRKAS
jgi:hypothetical protein